MNKKLRNWRCDKCAGYLEERFYVGTDCFHKFCIICHKRQKGDKCAVCEKDEIVMKVHLFGYMDKSSGSDSNNNSLAK